MASSWLCTSFITSLHSRMLMSAACIRPRRVDASSSVRAADSQRSAGLEETLKVLRQAHGLANDAATITAIAEVIAAMFEGLMVRAIRNPAVDRVLIARKFEQLIRAIVLG